MNCQFSKQYPLVFGSKNYFQNLYPIHLNVPNQDLKNLQFNSSIRANRWKRWNYKITNKFNLNKLISKSFSLKLVNSFMNEIQVLSCDSQLVKEITKKNETFKYTKGWSTNFSEHIMFWNVFIEQNSQKNYIRIIDLD